MYLRLRVQLVRLVLLDRQARLVVTASLALPAFRARRALPAPTVQRVVMDRLDLLVQMVYLDPLVLLDRLPHKASRTFRNAATEI